MFETDDNAMGFRRSEGSFVVAYKLPQTAFQERAEQYLVGCGMPKSAWLAWSNMHINPLAAIAHYYTSEMALLALAICMITGMHLDFSTNFWLVTAPWMVYILINITIAVGFWRCGPEFVEVKGYDLLLLAATLGCFPLLYVGYIAQVSAVPWNNRVLFMCVHVVAIWLASQTLLAGKVKGEHPAQPRTSILKPVLRATVNTMLLWDALTDLVVFKSLLHQVCVHILTLSLLLCSCDVAHIVCCF